MDGDKINRWLALGANIGVLVGIILLIAELGQNYEITRAQTRTDLSQSLLDLLALPASNRELSEIVVKANNGEELTAVEEYRLGTWSELVFSYWQNVHYQGRNGMYDDEEFSKHVQLMGSVLGNNPSLVRYWCGNQQFFPEALVNEIGGLISTDSCTQE